MKKRIKLFIKSEQKYSDHSNSELIEYNTEGILYKKREKYYLLYKNKDLLNANSRIKIEPLNKKVSIYRDKPKLNQLFIKNQEFSSDYPTACGVFDMKIYTMALDINCQQNRGKLGICYKLYLNKEYTSKNHLEISWEIL